MGLLALLNSALGRRRVLWTVLVAGALAVGATSFYHTVAGFFRLDFPAVWVADGIRLEAVPPGSSADRAGLAPGDLIVTIGSRSVRTMSDPLRGLAIGGEKELEVIGQDGRRRSMPYVPPRPRVDPVYLARTVVALFGLACAVFALHRTSRSEVPTFILLAIAAFILAVVPHRTASSALILNILHRMAGAGLSFFLVRFFAIFPRRRRLPRWWDPLTAVVMVASGATAFLPESHPVWQVMASALRVAFGLSLLTAAGLQVASWREAIRLARVRRQVEWTALGMVVGLLPYLGLVMVAGWLGISFPPYSWLTVLPMVAVPLGLLAGLTEYRLWDLEAITRDSLSLALFVVLGGLIFAAINQVLLSYASEVGSLRHIVAFATGVLLVMLLAPIRNQVERFLDRWLYHGRPAPRSLLTHSSRDLARETDPRQFFTEALDVDAVAAYLRAHDGSFVRVTGDAALPETLPQTITRTPFPSASESELPRSGLTRRLPLERATVIHGLLYLGLRRGIFPFGSEENEVIAAFMAQAALGLESARLLDDLRRRAEEYRILHANTQRIIESSAAAILVCDARGLILSANGRAAGILAEEETDLIGRRLDDVVELPANWDPHLPLHAVNAEASTRSSSPRHVVMAVSILEFERGQFNGRVVVMQDTTELRELETRLREQERLAALGRLAAGLAHEINTPLTGIASFAQMLESMTSDDDPRSSLVHKIVAQSFRVSRIVANLRELVRGDQSHFAAVDLHALVESTRSEVLRSLSTESTVVVESSDVPVWVWGQHGTLELAVSNLLRNAIEASPTGGAVRIRVVDDDDRAGIDIDDEGPGIPEELRQRVFEPFFTTRSEQGGTGLGLAITRDIIQQHGGQLHFEVSPQRGTRASFRIVKWQASTGS
jgi:hypothetical protein